MTYDQSLDANFRSYVGFYCESNRNPNFEATIRAQYISTKCRTQRKQAETLVHKYKAFNQQRASILQQFKDKANKTPKCALLKVLNDIEQSLECSFEDYKGEAFTCCISGQEHHMGKKMLLTPDPENPFGTVPKTYMMRSDFKEVLQSYRILSRFRYMVMKMVSEHTGVLIEDEASLQGLYDVFMRAQKVILAASCSED